jgi:response regulator of citrate/malate metabolism
VTAVFKVLIVEDQQVAAEALVKYVERMSGFEVIGHARNGTDALHDLAAEKVDLVLLDIYLPDMSGLELLRRIRAAGDPVDVIAMTQARDLSVVRAVVSFGAMQYLVKPFTFAAVRQRLERYQAYRSMLTTNEPVVEQQDIDHLLRTLRGSAADALPKGISSASLQQIMSALRQAGDTTAMSAVEVASSSGASRVTARRYLEFLVESGMAERGARYRGVGRPEAEYRLLRRGERGDLHFDDPS